MIFQEPMTSLNPVYTVGDQIAEGLQPAPRGSARRGARARRRDAARSCASRRPSARCDEYPHQLSGGMRQRVMIAMALACEPAAAHRRRADHRARRHHPGADPRPAARAAGDARARRSSSSPTTSASSPRPPTGRRHVRRPGRRGGAGGDASFADAQHPYTLGLLASDPAHRRGCATRLLTIPGRSRTRAQLPPAAASPRAARLRDRALRAREPPPLTRHRPGQVAALLAPRADRGAARMTPPLLEVEDLTKHFPVRGGLLRPRPAACVSAVDGVSLAIARGETLGARRRVRLRQVDHRPRHPAPHRADRRQRPLRRRGHHRPRRSALRAPAPAHADRLPGPVTRRSTRA